MSTISAFFVGMCSTEAAMLKPILLVEDSPNDVELTLLALEQHHLACQAMVLRDGAEALEYLQRRGRYAAREAGNPAVMILDIKLPLMTGLEVLKVVREDPDLKDLPIVMLTSSNEDPDLQIAYGMGVNAYIVKPLRFKDFVTVIASLGVFWGVFNKPPSAPFHDS
jgi:CheY-like chemotaxis protein